MYSHINKWACRVAGLLLFCLMTLVFVDVTGRTVFGRPIQGASELTEIGLATIVFLMLPRVALSGQHIVIDLVDSIVAPSTRALLEALASVLGAVMFGLIAWQVWIMAGKAISYEDLMPALRIPVGPVLYVMSIFSGVVVVAHLISIAKVLRGDRSGLGVTHAAGVADHGAV